jgi:phosphoglycolate/pyridoxal phosphate phosphatase family enzyme
MIEGIILDIDGVLRRGSEPIPGSVPAVIRLIGRGVRVVYLSNNSTKTPQDFARELTGMGFPDAPAVNSASATAELLLARFGRSRCLVLGEEGLFEELRRAGHDVTPAGRGMSSYRELPPPDHPIVVVGMDRSVDYTKLADAMAGIRSGAMFVATNEDPTLPIEGGRSIPGAGTVVWALRRCTGKAPFVVGKPEVHSTRIALNKLGVDPGRVLMVGDRIDTDIEAGKRCGLNVALVLTGDTHDPGRVDFPVHKDLSGLVDQILM